MRSVLVVDRRGLFVNGLCMLLGSLVPEHRIVVAPDIESMEREFRTDGPPDLMLVDMNSAGASWTVLRSLRHRFPSTRFLVMCSTNGRAETMRALENGLDGCISKAQPDDEIMLAIRAVLSGRIYVPPRASDLGDDGPSPVGEHAENERLHDGKLHTKKLTPRQRDILPLLAKGMSNKEIARALKIAEGTTKVHTSSLLRILGARNRTQAAVIAQQYLPHLETMRSDLQNCTGPECDKN
jgi:DNA-binding NarL/FixJ family response regulator